MFIQSVSVLDKKVNSPDCRQSLNLKKNQLESILKNRLSAEGIWTLFLHVFDFPIDVMKSKFETDRHKPLKKPTFQ